MYNKKTILFILFITVCLTGAFVSCKKEAALNPDKVYSGTPSLPQGASIYDTAIQNFYNTTGSYIVYQFSNEADLRFFMNGIPGVGIALPPAVYAVQIDTSVQAEKDTLNMAVRYVIDLLRSSYPPALLKQLLPYKILLYKYGCQLTANVAKPTGFDTTFKFGSMYSPTDDTRNLVEGFNCLGLGILRYNSSSINFPTILPYINDPANYVTNGQTFHKYLWVGRGGGPGTSNSPIGAANGAIGRGRIPMPASFSNITDYAALATQMATVTDATGNVLPGMSAAQKTITINNGMISATIRRPLDDYYDWVIKIASNTRANFDAYYITGVDDRGLKAQKRNAIVNFFKTTYDFNIENCWNR